MDYDPTDLQALQRNERRAELHREADLLQQRQFLRAVMATADGRGFVWSLIERSGVSPAACFVPGDATTTAFRLGRSAFGSEVLGDLLAIEPELYLLAGKEAAQLKAIQRERTEQQLRDDDGN